MATIYSNCNWLASPDPQTEAMEQGNQSIRRT